MKLKNTLLASALLSATAFSVNAATELTPEQAAAVKPFDRVVVTGRFNAIGEAVKAVSRRADKEGAASFYVVDTSDFGNSGNWRVVNRLRSEQRKQKQNCQSFESRRWKPLLFLTPSPAPVPMQTFPRNARRTAPLR